MLLDCPLLTSSNRKPSNLSLMHLTVSKVLPGEKLLTSYLTILGLDLELLCCCDLFSNKGCEFTVSAGTSCTVVQEFL